MAEVKRVLDALVRSRRGGLAASAALGGLALIAGLALRATQALFLFGTELFDTRNESGPGGESRGRAASGRLKGGACRPVRDPEKAAR